MLSYSTGESGSGRRRREGARGDRARPRARARAARGGPDPVRRGGGCRGRRREDARIGRRRSRDGVHLPRPQHRQQHVQGGAALRRRRRDRPGAAGAATSRSTTSRAARSWTTSSTPSPSRRSRRRASGRRERRPGRQQRIVLVQVPADRHGCRGGPRLRARGAHRRGGRDVDAHASASRRRSTPACLDATYRATRRSPTTRPASASMLDAFAEHGPSLEEHPPVAVGHRVVHGGARFFEPTLITPLVEINIDELSVLAPLHNPANLRGHPRGEEGIPGRPARRRLRHRVPPDAAARRLHLRDRRGARRAPPRPPLRLPRHVAQVRLAKRRPRFLGRPLGELQADRASPRQRRIRHAPSTAAARSTRRWA